MLARFLFAMVACLCLAVAWPAHAHGMRSAYLEISENEAGRAMVRLSSKVPTHGLRIVAPAGCELSDGTLSCDGAISGRELRVEGLGTLVNETALYFTSAAGETQSELLTSERPACTLGPHRSFVQVASHYIGLGWSHIWNGADHLLFLLGLVLVLRRWRAVLWAETAFTLSHSLSFSAAALGWVHVSPLAAEACIALSLVLIALDVRQSKPSVRHGAIVAFGFGLVHGLGFAGGLSEIGFSDQAILPALVGFAAGVELGQVAFLALAVATFAMLRRVRFAGQGEHLGAYALGGIGCFWLLERSLAVFGK